MCATARLSVNDTPPEYPPTIERIRRWGDLAEFCIDAPTERERVDVLVILAAELEAALEAAIAAERAA